MPDMMTGSASPAAGPGPQQGPPPTQGGGDSPAVKAIQDIQQGFASLGKMMESGGQSLPPEDLKLFQQAASATDAMIQSLTGGGGDEESAPPEKEMKSGPMAMNQKSGSQVPPNQG